MITKFTKAFLKDLDKINQANIKSDILNIVEEIENATLLSDIGNIKRLKGCLNAYRIRSGNYRIGFLLEENVVKLGRVAHRKDIYKVFP